MGLILLRHPPVTSKGCYGRLDVPLEEGWQERVYSSSILSNERTILSSPSARCRILAECLHKNGKQNRSSRCSQEATLSFDDRLLERFFGTWEGKDWEEVPRNELDLWCQDFEGYHPGGGECLRSMRQRVSSFLEEFEGQNKLCVTHAGVIKIAVSLWDGVTGFDILSIPIEPLCFYHYDWTKREFKARNQRL